jgi:hypothetical protein
MLRNLIGLILLAGVPAGLLAQPEFSLTVAAGSRCEVQGDAMFCDGSQGMHFSLEAVSNGGWVVQFAPLYRGVIPVPPEGAWNEIVPATTTAALDWNTALPEGDYTVFLLARRGGNTVVAGRRYIWNGKIPRAQLSIDGIPASPGDTVHVAVPNRTTLSISCSGSSPTEVLCKRADDPSRVVSPLVVPRLTFVESGLVLYIRSKVGKMEYISKVIRVTR